jgi:hypothetical protein
LTFENNILTSDDDTTFEKFRFNDEDRLRLKKIIELAWNKSSASHVKKRASIGTKRKILSDLEIDELENTVDKIDPFDRAIDDLETVVGWELTRLKSPKPERTKRQPTKRHLVQIRSAAMSLIDEMNDLKKLDCLINVRFNKLHRRNLSIELHHLISALDQEIPFHRTGQKKKPHVRMALEVARWMLLFEIEPKKTGNMIEILEIVFAAGNIVDGSERHAIDNAWNDIRQPEKTWPDFYESPPNE